MNNKEVAHLWANQSRESASGSHFFFDGATIYSYGSHFPIARHYKGVVLFTTKGYSRTTSQHKSIVRSACSHLTIFEVSNPCADPSGKDVKEWGEQIKSQAMNAAKARNPAAHLESLEQTVKDANDFCSRFGFKTRFSMKKAKAAREAKFESDCEEIVQRWLAGESVSIPHQYTKCLLRARTEIEHKSPISDGHTYAFMETSKGARVALPEANKAYRFAVAMRSRGWRKNGDQFKVGDYQLDAVNEQGVVAGCHRVAWEEIERFAKLQGWA